VKRILASLSMCLAALIFVTPACDSRKGPTPASTLPPAPSPKQEPKTPDVDSLLAEVRREKPRHNVEGEDFKAISQLHNYVPANHPRQRDIFKQLLEIGYSREDANSKDLIVRAAIRYAGKDEVPELLDIPNHGPYVNLVWANVLARLAEIKDPSCAETVAKSIQYDFGRTHHQRDAAKVLRAIGSPAEKAVRPYALPNQLSGQPHQLETRMLAVDILGDIGDKATIDFLNGLDGPPMFKDAVARATKAINSRTK
jgi:hypothetical protein